MTKSLSVDCHYLENELMRVRFAKSQIVSDHPVAIGGEGTGPSPGVMLQMALAAATAFAGHKQGERLGLDMSGITVRTSMGMRSEGFKEGFEGGPLSRLSYIDRYWRLLEIEGQVDEEQAASIAMATQQHPVVKAMRDGIQIDEGLTCVPGPGPRGSPAAKNPWHLQGENSQPMPPGEVQIGPPPENWRLAATLLDDHCCLVRAEGAIYAVGNRLEDDCGPTPEELLLAGLGACTTIYVARNAALLDIPVDGVRVTVTAEPSDDGSLDLTKLTKSAQVTGSLSDDEVAKLDHIAFHCALGESLKRGALMSDTVSLAGGSNSPPTSSPLTTLRKNAPKPDNSDFSNVANCCVVADAGT